MNPALKQHALNGISVATMIGVCYGFTLSSAVLSSRLFYHLLDWQRGEATVTAIMLSFLLFAAALIYGFTRHSRRLALRNLLTISAICAGLVWLMPLAEQI